MMSQTETGSTRPSGPRRGSFPGPFALLCALSAGLLLMFAGCPVYELADQKATGNCAPGTDGQSAQADCPCKGKYTLIQTGDPIPGMDDGAVPRRGGTLRVHLDANLPSLNRLTHSDSWIKRVVHHSVYEALVRQDARDYGYKPELAESWSANSEGTVWTFKLRKGVTWHDGKPFTARDVKFTFDTMLNPNNRTEHIRTEWQDVIDPKDPYSTPDDYTFVIRLKKPLALFLANVDDITILPEHVFSRGDFNNHPNLRSPVGTGPFKFKAWTADDIIIERNENYWGKPAYLDSIIFRVVTDRDTAFSMIKRGDLDFMWRLMPTHRTEGITPEVLDKYRLIDLMPASDWGFWLFNTKRPQFEDARVRRAFSYLIDREKILCEIYQCQGQALTGPIPRNHPANDTSIKPFPFDAVEAARLLDEAGWKDTDGDGIRDKLINGQKVNMSVTFMATQSSRSLEQVVTVVQNAARRVGVDIQISKIDWSVFTDRLRKFDFDVVSFIYGGTHEPDLYSIFHSAGGQNYGKWKNEEADLLVDRSRFIMDPVMRNLALRRVHQILQDEQPYAFTFAAAVPALVRKDVRGVYTSDLWYQVHEWWLNDSTLPEVPVDQRRPGDPGAPQEARPPRDGNTALYLKWDAEEKAQAPAVETESPAPEASPATSDASPAPTGAADAAASPAPAGGAKP